MLSVPDEITVELFDIDRQPFRVDNVLIGIHVFANSRNNIDIYPFYTDTSGRVRITKKEIIEAADRFIDFGLMDYAPLESARPQVEIYVWSQDEIERYIKYWEAMINKTGTFDSEKKNIERFNASNNKNISGAITRVWNGRKPKYHYILKIKKTKM